MKKFYLTIAAFTFSICVNLYSDEPYEGLSDTHTPETDTGALAFTKFPDTSRVIDKDPVTANQINTPSALLKGFPDIEKIVQRGTLKIAVNTFSSNEPFIIKDEKTNSYYGLDIAIISSFCKYIGVKPEFNYSAQNILELFDLLSSGEADVAVGDLSRSFQRMKYVYFSSSYATLYQSVIMNNDDLKNWNVEKNPYKYLEQNEVKIGVESETAYAEFAQLDFPKATILKYAAESDDWNDLPNHKIAAIFGDSNEMATIARKYPEIALKYSIYVFYDLKITKGIAISPKNPNLVMIINSYLEMHDVIYTLEDMIHNYPDVYKCE